MRLPAEWESQDGVQLTWPHCDTEWYELEKVLECYVEIAYSILRFERVIIATREIDECKADISRIAIENPKSNDTMGQRLLREGGCGFIISMKSNEKQHIFNSFSFWIGKPN